MARPAKLTAGAFNKVSYKTVVEATVTENCVLILEAKPHLFPVVS